MMSESNRQLLTAGVLLVTVVVAILLYTVGLYGWLYILPVVLVLFGCWMIVLAGIRESKAIKYERSSFGTLALGLCLIALGGAWFLFSSGWIYSLLVILIVIAAIAIAAALRRK